MSIQVEITSKSNDEEQEAQYLSRILHHKCNVIKLIREQIQNVAVATFPGEPGSGPSPSRSESSTSSSSRNRVIAAIVTLLVFWLVFIYGAFTGAAICCNGPAKGRVCSSVASPQLVIPGFMSVSKHQNIY